MSECKYVLITSCGRSGSTLLNMLLGAHAKAVAVGELTKLMRVDSCSCGATPVASCPFWACVIERAEAHGDFVSTRRKSLTESLPGSAYRRARDLFRLSPPKMPALASSTFAVLDAALDVSKASVVIDSTKEPGRAVALLRSRPDSCRIIQLIRDGRGVCSSLLRQSSDEPAWQSKMRGAAGFWRRTNERILRALNHVPDSQQMQVRYEDLAEGSGATLSRICDFVMLESTTGMLEYAETPQHLAGGNRMRFERSSRLFLDERWRKDLTSAQLREFEAVAGDLNRAFGYEAVR